MLTVKARNVHQALPEVMRLAQLRGYERESRNGPVRLLPEPLSIEYARPTERVVFWAQRDANPFFHLFEALWMLAGRADVAFPARFAKQLAAYSDNGRTFNAAYGWRWRSFFGVDQLNSIVAALRKDPNDRRQVLAMWDARRDLGLDSKDIPCNLTACFQLGPWRAGDMPDGSPGVAFDRELNMLVSNRSNDLVWGALGANAVHFSVLQEYLAARIGAKVGTYHQVTMNGHVYQRHYGLMAELADVAAEPTIGGCGLGDPYLKELVGVVPLVQDPERFERELHAFVDGAHERYKEPFLARVALPLLCAHDAWARDDLAGARHHLVAARDCDWKRAASEWLERRVDKKLGVSVAR